MKFVNSPEQTALQQTARQILAKEWSPIQARELRDGKADVRRVHRVLGGAGLLGLALPDELGGGDGDLVDLGVLFAESGRALGPTTTATSVDAMMLLRAVGAAPTSPWFGRLLAGEAIGTVAAWNPDDAEDVRPRVVAELEGDVWRLHGRVPFVRNGGVADVIVVSARTVTGSTILVPLEPGTTGLRVIPRTTFAGDDQADLLLEDLRVEDTGLLGAQAQSGGAGLDGMLHRVARASTALQCAEMVGGARVVLERTTAYLKEREQFGRPIGAFQAAQHHVADLRMAVDGAELVVGHALALLEEGADAAREVAIAKVKAGRAYRFVTQTAHQLHGGIGFARESDLYLWSERAKALDLLGGGPETHLQHLASVLPTVARPQRACPVPAPVRSQE